jgi:hypothetical protein
MLFLKRERVKPIVLVYGRQSIISMLSSQGHDPGIPLIGGSMLLNPETIVLVPTNYGRGISWQRQ